jgi:dolichol-phosphate mannosyltransferase
MIGWMGYRTVILPYHQPERYAGRSKYSLRKMVRLFTHALFSFSMVPVFAVISIGLVFFCMAAVEVIYVLSLWLRNSDSLVPGWSSLMFMILIVGGALMISLGFIGVYVGNIFREVKGRPLYLVREEKNVRGE